MKNIIFSELLLLTTLISCCLSEVPERSGKWVWGDGDRSKGQLRASEDYLQASGPEAKYEIHEFQEGYNPRPDIAPPDFRPPNDYRQDGPFLNRPLGIRPGGFSLGASGFIGSGPYGRPPGAPGSLGPAAFNGAPHGPGFGPNGELIRPGIGGPFKHFDTCKCTEKFNCASPGLSYGHCDVGKSYCCYNSRNPYASGPFPVKPIHSPANGVLVGPGGPIDPPVGGPIGVRPIDVPPLGPGGFRPPNGINPIGVRPLVPGVPGQGVIGPGGPIGAGGPYGGYAGGYGGYGRPLPGPLGPRPLNNPANGILVGPGGPFDHPNAPQRPSPLGPGPFGSGAFGFGRNNKQLENLQSDDPDDSEGEKRKGKK